MDYLQIFFTIEKTLHLILAKRISDSLKEKIIKEFTNGKTVDEIAEIYNYTKLTISRNLKKSLGIFEFESITQKNKKISNPKSENLEENKEISKNAINSLDQDFFYEDENLFNQKGFVEIKPLNHEFDESLQKDLSSIPIDQIELPKVVYMLIDKNTELETKLLKEFPEWQFLSKEDLNRKTIKIYSDIKNAKRDCNKEQKVIKIPNSNVFKITAKILLSKGISRIINDEVLISI